MEMGSSSVAVSGVCGSNDSLNGLMFGKKIYFEDVGSGGSSSKASVSSKRGKRAAQGGQQPPRCQVEGCKVDLSCAKTYYSRHKVCGMHSKSPKVIVAGFEQRFCQQCSRFHQLPEFDQGKRSCRRRLAGHNERRRKPPPGSLSPRIGWLSPSPYENNRFRGFIMDFTRPRLAGASRDVWPTIVIGDRLPSHQWQGGLGVPANEVPSHGAHPYMPSSICGPPFCAHGNRPSEFPGVLDSSCALSLLSTQSWSSTATENGAPTLSVNRSVDLAPVAQQVTASGYVATNLWGFRGIEGSGRLSGVQHEMGLERAIEPAESAQFSGELELALKGSRQCMDLEPGRVYSHSDDVIHWSL